MSTDIEGIYKDGVIKPLGNVKLEDNTKVVITIKNKMKNSLLEFAGVWKNRKDINSRFKKILKEREKFSTRR